MDEQKLERIRYWQSRTPEERLAETARLSVEAYAKEGFDPLAAMGNTIRIVKLDQISNDDW